MEDSSVSYTRVAAAIIGVVLALAFVVGIVLVPTGFKSVPVDQIGLHYSDGPIEGQHFAGIIKPGTGKRFIGVMDKLVKLPVTQRDYIVSLDPDDGDKKGPDSIKAPAKGGVEMAAEVAVHFTLNTSPDVIRPFYERVCIKFKCETDKGWDKMLATDFRKPIEQAIQEQFRQYTVEQLYGGGQGADAKTPVLVEVQNAIARDLKVNINNILGGDYFCGPTFDRTHPEICPDFQFQIISATPTSQSVRDSFSNNAASLQDIITAQNNAQAKVAAAEGDRKAQEALAGLYADPSYRDYLRAKALQSCAANSNCTIVVSNGDVITQAGK